MGVRAKFRCSSITLTQQTRTKEGVRWENNHYVDADGNEISRGEVYESWEQPTVKLTAVVGTSGENSEFFAATPTATCEMVISNPDAAQFFELGQEYYLDFSRASA